MPTDIIVKSPTAFSREDLRDCPEEPVSGAFVVWLDTPGFGPFIREARADLNLSIAKAAKLVKVSATYMRLLEQGEGPAQPSRELCARLSVALDLDFRVVLDAAGARYAMPSGAVSGARESFRRRTARLLFHERLERPEFTRDHFSALPEPILHLYHDLPQRIDTNARVGGPTVEEVLAGVDPAFPDLALHNPSEFEVSELRQIHAEPSAEVGLVWLPSRGFGAHLKQLRAENGLSVRAAAAEVGLSPSYISTLEGSEGPDHRRFELCEDFARAYEADLRTLLQHAGARVTQPPPIEERTPPTSQERLAGLLAHERFEVDDFNLSDLRFLSDFIARDLIAFAIAVDKNGRTGGPRIFDILDAEAKETA